MRRDIRKDEHQTVRMIEIELKISVNIASRYRSQPLEADVYCFPREIIKTRVVGDRVG